MREVDRNAERLVAVLAGRELPPEPLTEADWNCLLQLAVRHGLAPVLHTRLKHADPTPPPSVSKELHDAYVASAARNVRLFHELDRILRAMQAAGIQVIPLKGACLAEEVYGDVALRPMGDLDLWVRREQLEASRAVMQSLSYVSRSRMDRPLALQDALTGETQMYKDGGLLVELHWNIFPGEWVRHTARIDEDVVWKRTVPSKVAAVQQVSPEDFVLQSCVHAAITHQMSEMGLRTLVDLDFARRQWRIDWHLVAQRARAWRVSSATWLVLAGLAELFGDPARELPLREVAPSPLRRSVLRYFASPRMVVEGLDLTSGPKRFLYLLSLVDRPVDAIFLGWRALFPDRLWLTLRYESPDASSWHVWLLRARHVMGVVMRGET